MHLFLFFKAGKPMKRYILCFLGWIQLTLSPSWAETPHFTITQELPLQGELVMPLLEIDGRAQFKNIVIDFDFATSTFELKAVESVTNSEQPRQVMLGAYLENYAGDPDVIENDLKTFDTWAGTGLSIVGLFLNVEEQDLNFNIITPLTELKKNGYTAFINFNSVERSMAEIAQGVADHRLADIAANLATWFQRNPDNKVFIAPFPEMNGSWESYGQDMENFKKAYANLQTLFNQAGVPNQNIYWVFAPNGWSEEGHEFENYYPENSQVDVVAFSAYNWGYCTSASYKSWETYKEVYAPYIQRIQLSYPDKPIFISQTATASNTESGSNLLEKDTWLEDSYRYLSEVDNLYGIMYFNLDKECDWAIHRPESGQHALGYQNIVSQPPFAYVENTKIPF